MKRSAWLLIFLVLTCLVVPPASSQSGSLFDEAIESYKKEDFREVIRLLEAHVEKTPEPRAYYILGYSLYELGRHDEATQAFQDAYLIDPEFQPQVIEALFGPPGTWVPPTREPMRDLRLLQGTRYVESRDEERPSEAAPAPEPVEMVPVPPESAFEETVQQAQPELIQPEPIQAEPAEPEPAQPVPAIQETVQQAEPEPAQPSPAPARQPVPVKPSPVPGTPPDLPKDFPFDLDELSRQIPGGPDAVAKVMAMMAGFTIIAGALGIAFYIYYCLCLFLIARKLQLSSAWLAWVPLLQIWTFVTSAGKSFGALLLLLSPMIGGAIMVFSPTAGGIIALAGAIIAPIFSIYLVMCISENVGESKWLGLLVLVPVANIILPGYLAFSKMEAFDSPPGFSFDDESGNEGMFQEEA